MQVPLRIDFESLEPSAALKERVHLKLPGGEIAVSRDAGDDDPYLTVRDAFHQARRQLEDFVRVRRGDVKEHSRPRAARRVS